VSRVPPQDGRQVTAVAPGADLHHRRHRPHPTGFSGPLRWK